MRRRNVAPLCGAIAESLKLHRSCMMMNQLHDHLQGWMERSVQPCNERELDALLERAKEDVQLIMNGRRDVELSSAYNMQYMCVIFGRFDDLYDMVTSSIRRLALCREKESFYSTCYAIKSVSGYMECSRHMECGMLLEYAERVFNEPVCVRWRKVCRVVRKLPFIKRMRALFDEVRFRVGGSGMLQCRDNFFLMSRGFNLQ